MTLKFTDLQQRLKEAKEKKIVFSFGRMNPPTIGHEKLVNKIKSEAKARGADARLYLSHTSNKEKDPLTYNEKAKYAKKAFGIFKKSRARTIIEVAKELEADGYTDITLVFGEDRDAEMVNLIKRYNGKILTSTQSIQYPQVSVTRMRKVLKVSLVLSCVNSQRLVNLMCLSKHLHLNYQTEKRLQFTIKFAKYILSAMMLCLTEMNSVKHISWASSSM